MALQRLTIFVHGPKDRRTNIGLDLHHFPLSLQLGEWDVDGPGARREAEAPIEPRPAGIERVTASSTPASVAERDIGRSHQAGGVRSVETGTISFVNSTVASADGPTAAVAVNYPRIEGVALGKRSFGAAGEGQQ